MFNHYSYGPMGWGNPFEVFWWIIAIFALVWVLRYMFGGHRGHFMRHGPWSERSALDILKERYAKGEIDKAEFEEKKKDIQG